MKILKADKSHTAYDKGADVLYIGLGESSCTDAVEVNVGLTVYYDLETKNPVGISVENFSKVEKIMPITIKIHEPEPFEVQISGFQEFGNE
ncbi:MAG: DUF2283 domain-containing protein [Coriobacteriia bacterium]|nr:DUF2283 domain-containing protein [Coriobacteriia bacterium]